ncbi:unnamed protein product [Blepharisma stoltei]|uniref:Uncharacterized protein n=1 Tax=Blepharisma stoltei TaxID=1481888 RepID=A0AAU9ITB7_9CILI|nr:unnamed protein product [Blepharisma stoltei]
MNPSKKFLSCEYIDENFYIKSSFGIPYTNVYDQERQNSNEIESNTVMSYNTAKNEFNYDNKTLSIVMNPQTIKSFVIMTSSIPQNIINLSIVNSFLGHKIVRNLSLVLNDLISLKYLDLSGNSIEDRGMNLLKENGDCLARLETFIVCLNHITYKGALLIADFYIFKDPMHIVAGNFNLQKWKKYREAVKAFEMDI